MADERPEILTVEGREVRITHPSKLYFSKAVQLTKLDLIRYYMAVAPGALRGIANRPIAREASRRCCYGGSPPVLFNPPVIVLLFVSQTEPADFIFIPNYM
jgi:DNA primase